MRLFAFIIIFLFFAYFYSGFSAMAEQKEGLVSETKARQRLRENLSHPLTAYWRNLKPMRPEGRSIKEFRIIKMKRETEQRPAYAPFEKIFIAETMPDERVFQARDVFYARQGILQDLRQRLQKDGDALDSFALTPRQRLQRALGRRILRRLLLQEDSELDELIKYMDFRESFLTLGQDELPDDFEFYLRQEKHKMSREEPLRPFKMRLFRELIDARARVQILEWRQRGCWAQN